MTATAEPDIVLLARPKYNVHIDGGVPIKIWSDDIEAGALEQAVNLSRLPFVISHVALMPDCHQGYGMPIGGVLFADKAVVPYAIGVDIGCGVALACSVSLTREQLGDELLHKILVDIELAIPTGFTKRPRVAGARDRAIEALGAPPDAIDDSWFSGAVDQLGTLGGGNHFIELQSDEAGVIYCMIHSGSRSLGKKICDYYHKAALAQNIRWHSRLPHKELAYIVSGDPLFNQYWDAMEYALKFAEASRRLMMEAVSRVLEDHTGVGLTFLNDVHHNYAAWENHAGKNGIVHRKGAVRAREGDVVFIPGSMGTSSYVGVGLGNRDSFNTCQHGAGRAMSRTKALGLKGGMTADEVKAVKARTSAEVYTAMREIGVDLVSSAPLDVAEEAPFAYKDIENVMARSTDLVAPMTRLRPVGVVKG